MDVSEILDGTLPVEVKLAGKVVTCHVYTAGFEVRATLDQLADIEPLRSKVARLESRTEELEAELSQSVPDERRGTLENELVDLQIQKMKATASMSAAVVPLLVKDAEIEGEPFTYNGRPFSQCASSLPAIFLMEIMGKAKDVLANPTTPDLSESGSGLAEAQEIDQAENMPA